MQDVTARLGASSRRIHSPRACLNRSKELQSLEWPLDQGLDSVSSGNVDKHRNETFWSLWIRLRTNSQSGAIRFGSLNELSDGESKANV